MGLGKTFIGSEKMVGLGNSVNLVICQKSKVDDWIEHFKNYYGGYIYNLTDKKQFKAFDIQMSTYNCSLQDKLYPTGKPKVFAVINYELAWRRKELLNLKDFTLMLDESSIIQNTSTKMWKAINKMKPRNVILLSGTPCSGKYENLWSQAHLLGWQIDEKTFLKHYINFRKIDTPIGIKKIIDKENPYRNQERLKNKLREYGAVFMKTDEVFELPQQTFINVKIPVIKEYKKFLKESIVTIDGVDLVGNTQLTKLLYARQLCGQFNQGKLDAIKDLLQSTNDRIVIFYNFNDELAQLIKLCEELNKPTSQVNGPIKDLTAYENEENSVTLCQYQSASKGLNLQKANKIIYFTPTLSVENWMQSQKRIHRIGQEKPCFYYKLICGIEAEIYRSLERGVDYTDDLFKEELK